MNENQPLWSPSQASIDAANMSRFIAQVNRNYDLAIADYDTLYQWSVDEKESFWSEVWDFCGIIGDKGATVLIDGDNIEPNRKISETSRTPKPDGMNRMMNPTNQAALHALPTRSSFPAGISINEDTYR